jgi:hypothetical protein
MKRCGLKLTSPSMKDRRSALSLPETLHAFMLIVVVSAGAGPYSLDAAILGLIDKPGALLAF